MVRKIKLDEIMRANKICKVDEKGIMINNKNNRINELNYLGRDNND